MKQEKKVIKKSEKQSRRHTQAEREAHDKKLNEARETLRQQNKKNGVYEPQQSVPDCQSPHKTVEEECEEREEAVEAQIKVFRLMLPTWLKQLSKLEDPRQAKKVKHKLTVVLLFGLLSFVFQMSSRRQLNKQMSRPVFLQTLQRLFPELESLPHADTLNRLLNKLDISELEAAHVKIINQLIRNKKFCNFLIEKSYPIAIDGTQKLVRDGSWWAEEWLERRRGSQEGEWVQQYVYVLEANLVFSNGITLPLLSEFLSHAEGDPDDHKQDCELKAFKRLSERLKAYFPQLTIMLLLDGLYPNGPVFELCSEYKWDFMIVLPDKSLSTVWEEIHALRPLMPKNQLKRNWNGRRQNFYWISDISYEFTSDQKAKVINIHVAVCEEEWETVNAETAEIETKTSRHVWVSRNPLDHQNIHERCNLGARRRWQIEDSMHTEKRRGYCYEHPFSYSWDAMKGYHYLMRLAHLMHAVAFATKRVKKQVRKLGRRELLFLVKETCANPWLSKTWIADLLAKPFQLRLE